MYMAELTALLTQALRNVFTSNYPLTPFQGLHISPEFPIARANYPGVWVDFEPTGPLHTGGISQILWTPTVDSVTHAYKVWMFQGYATFTVVALSSLERDRLFDELVKIFAFGQLNPQLAVFRQTIESNKWIATNIDFDQISQRGKAATSGTPWGTDEMVYEITLAVQCLGEFASDPSTGEFVLLEDVIFVATPDPHGPVDTFTYPN